MIEMYTVVRTIPKLNHLFLFIFYLPDLKPKKLKIGKGNAL